MTPKVEVGATGGGNGSLPRTPTKASILDRPYKCDQCTASFIEESECEEHRRKHSDDGPFNCDDCHFTFMYKSHFKSHKTRCEKKRATLPPNLGCPAPAINSPKLSNVKRLFPTHSSCNDTNLGHSSQEILTTSSGAVVSNTRRRGGTRIVGKMTNDTTKYISTSPAVGSVNSNNQLLVTSAGNTTQVYYQVDEHESILIDASDINADSKVLISNPLSNSNNLMNGSQHVQLVSQPKAGTGNQRGSPNKRLINGPHNKSVNTNNTEVLSFNPVKPSFKRLKRLTNDTNRPHECDACDASFTTTDDLAQHKLKHSSGGPYRCESCQFLYLYRRLYDAHKRKCKKGRSGKDGPVHTNDAVSSIAISATNASNANASTSNNFIASHQQQIQDHNNQQHQQLVLQQQQIQIQQQPSTIHEQQQHEIITVPQGHTQQIQQQQVQQPHFIYLESPAGKSVTNVNNSNQQGLSNITQLDLSSLGGNIGTLQLGRTAGGMQVLTGGSSGGMQVVTGGGNVGMQVLGTGNGGMILSSGVAGGMHLVNVSNTAGLVEGSSVELIAVASNTPGGEIKYGIVQAVDQDNVAQIMSFIKKGNIVQQ